MTFATLSKTRMPKKSRTSGDDEDTLQTIRQKIREFGVLAIQDDIVDRVWEDDCTEEDILSISCPTEKNISSLISSIQSLEKPEGLWTYLVEEDVPIKTLLVWMKVRRRILSAMSPY